MRNIAAATLIAIVALAAGACTAQPPSEPGRVGDGWAECRGDDGVIHLQGGNGYIECMEALAS